jgi:hypothetical protein
MLLPISLQKIAGWPGEEEAAVSSEAEDNKVLVRVFLGKQFWINILLTILGYIPGIVHAVWVIAKY